MQTCTHMYLHKYVHMHTILTNTPTHTHMHTRTHTHTHTHAHTHTHTQHTEDHVITTKCEQICQKWSYIRTVSRHTFHHHLLAASMDQQHMSLILLKVEQSAITQPSFSSLSDVHKCSGGIQMAPSSLDEQTPCCDLSHN